MVECLPNMPKLSSVPSSYHRGLRVVGRASGLCNHSTIFLSLLPFWRCFLRWDESLGFLGLISPTIALCKNGINSCHWIKERGHTCYIVVTSLLYQRVDVPTHLKFCWLNTLPCFYSDTLSFLPAFCVCMWLHVCVGPTHVCMEVRSRLQLLLLRTTLSFLRQYLSLAWISQNRLGSVAIEPQMSPHLCLPSAGIASTCHHAQLFTWLLVWIPRPNVGTTNTL